MKNLIRDVWLALTLIAASSGVLLLSDLEQRQKYPDEEKQKFPSIAIMQISSTTVLDAHVRGVIHQLQQLGHIAPDKHNVKLFNPQMDYSVANSIAWEIANGPYDIVITSSTLALQIYSKANQNVRKPHVFGAVTDPYGAGVGITGPEPENHPEYMAGIGTFQPVRHAFTIIKEMNPNLQRVGVVWNPGEQCSEACLREARIICKDLQLGLIEANATNTSEVPDAVRSIASQNIQAIWIAADAVAVSSSKLIIQIAGQHNIPVFTNDPFDATAGALFGLGADYFTVGVYTADIAAAILKGVSPATFRIDNIIPEQFNLNYKVLASLGQDWNINQVVQALLDKNNISGIHEPAILDFADLKAAGIKPNAEMIKSADRYLNVAMHHGRPAIVAVINLIENLLGEEAEHGVEAGMQEKGLKPNEDYIIKKFNAQGEMAQLPQIIEAAIHEKPDVIVTVTTPVMIAVANRIIDIPVVFTVCSDPAKMNLFTKGRPGNICGVHDNPPLDSLLDMARKYDPSITSVGIVYDAAQMNSVLSVDKLRQVSKERNINVLEATASTVSELGIATQSLIQRGAKAIIISADNLANTGFPSIYKIAKAAGIPIFATEPKLVEQGATGAYGDSFFEWGKQSGKMVAKIIAGVPPSELPITETEVQIKIEPKGMNVRPSHATPYKLRVVLYSETSFAERGRDGLLDGLAQAGLKEGLDYNMKIYNAQGDMSTLSSIMNTIRSERVDLLMTISTPTLQAALRQAGTHTKIVFTCVGDGVQAGAGKSETDHLLNVTGITTRSPFEGMVDIIRETMPGTKRVGTLFTPAEINSELYKNWFAEELQKEGIELIAIPVTTSADVPQATAELCSKDIQLVGQIVDNLTRPGFALIARKAAEKQLPVFVFDSDQMADGGTLCLARDYYDAGIEAAQKAVRVLGGENPGNIPFNNTQSEKLIINHMLANRYMLRISKELMLKSIPYIPKQQN